MDDCGCGFPEWLAEYGHEYEQGDPAGDVHDDDVESEKGSDMGLTALRCHRSLLTQTLTPKP